MITVYLYNNRVGDMLAVTFDGDTVATYVWMYEHILPFVYSIYITPIEGYWYEDTPHSDGYVMATYAIHKGNEFAISYNIPHFLFEQRFTINPFSHDTGTLEQWRCEAVFKRSYEYAGWGVWTDDRPNKY